MDNISITINDKTYSGAEDYKITKSLNSLCNIFSMSFSDNGSSVLNCYDINEGDSIKLFINGARYMSCNIDQVTQNSSSFTLTAREKTSILIDCSVIVKNNQLENVTFDNFIKALLKPFNINYTISEIVNKKFKLIKFGTNESVYEAIIKQLKNLNLIVETSQNGDVKILNATPTKADTELILGYNIEDWEVVRDSSKRYSEYTVKSKNSTKGRSWESTSFFVSATVRDENISFYKPLIIQTAENLSASECKLRAEYEKSRRISESQNIKIKVEGFKQTNSSSLWDTNLLTYVNISKANIDGYFLIPEITFDKSLNGTSTTITLTPKGAFHV